MRKTVHIQVFDSDTSSVLHDPYAYNRLISHLDLGGSSTEEVAVDLQGSQASTVSDST